MVRLSYSEFVEYIKKHGVTLAKITSQFGMIPSGTKLYFGIREEKFLSTYGENTDYKNRGFNYRFNYSWCEGWRGNYEGDFEMEDAIPETPIEIKMEEEDIEALKSFDPKNLAEGKKLAEAELAQKQTEEAKRAYLSLYNKKQEAETKAKRVKDEIKELDKMLGVFKVK